MKQRSPICSITTARSLDIQLKNVHQTANLREERESWHGQIGSQERSSFASYCHSLSSQGSVAVLGLTLEQSLQLIALLQNVQLTKHRYHVSTSNQELNTTQVQQHLPVL